MADSTAPKNQNVLLTIVFAMFLLIALMLFFKQPNATPNNNTNNQLVDLKKSVAEKEQQLLSLGIPLPQDTNSIELLSARIQQDAQLLRSNASNLQSTLSDKQAALDKAQLELKAATTLNQSITDELSTLKKQIANSQSESTQIQQLQQQVNTLQQNLADKETQITQLSSRPTADTLAKFRSSLNETMLLNESLNQKIAELEQQLHAPKDSSN